MALYYPLSASLILFAHILSNPQTHHQHHIQLMNQLTSFINAAVQPGSSFAATPTLSMFQALYGIATRFVAKAHASGNVHVPQSSLSRNGRTKTRMPGDENADDFELHPDTTQTQTQTQTHPVSSSRAQPLPDESSSLYPDLNSTSSTQSTILPEEIIPEPSQSPTTIDTSPLNFAPFLPDQTYDYPINMNINFNSIFEWNWDMNIDMNMDDMDMNMNDIDMNNTWMSSALNTNPDADSWVTTEGDNLTEANQEFGFRPDVI